MIVLLSLWLASATPPGRAGAVPPALTEVAPALAVRWRARPIQSEERGRVSTLEPRQSRVTLTTSPLLRLRGRFKSGCGPLASRVFASGSTELEVPLPVPGADGDEVVLLVPPALAPAPLGGGQLAPVTVSLALPPGCAAVAVEVYEAEADPHPDGGAIVARELHALLDAPPDDGTLARWLAAPHPRRWQEEAALALALPRLLGGQPGAPALAAALLQQATAGPRAADPAFAVLSNLGEGPGRSLGGEGDWRVVPAGESLELEVAGEEVVRVNHRGVAVVPGAALAWRLEAAFDADAPVWLLGRAPVDPDAPEASWPRSRELVVPPGARRLRLRAGSQPVLVWVVGAHAKASLLGSSLSVERALDQASRAGGWVGRLAREWSRQPEIAPEPTAEPLPAALLAVLRAQRAPDADETASWLRRAGDHLDHARTPLERAAAGLVEAAVVRLRAQGLVAAGQPAQAAAAWLALAARRPLCDEDAQALLEADGFAQEELTGSPQALLAVDGLLARRPLDRELRLARQRAFTGSAQWTELSPDLGPREVHFLDPLPDDGAVAAPEHARFVALEPGRTREVELPAVPLAGQLPLLAVVALRPPGAPALVRVSLDGVGYTVPALGPLDRVDLPGRPGRHLVRLSSDSGATQVLVNWSGGREPGRRWRRYLEVDQKGLELHNRDLGSGDLIAVAVRVVAPPGRDPGPLRLVLEGGSQRPLILPLRVGALSPGASGDLDAELRSSAVVEAVVPVAASNATYRLSAPDAPPGVRILVHVSVRRRAPAVILERPPARAPGRELPAETVAQLTARLLQRPRAALFVQRAAALAELDELALAREDIVRALGEPRLDGAVRAQALAIWRHLDNVASSSFPDTVDGRSAWAHSPAFGFVLAPMPADQRALVRLADDRAALRKLDARALIAAGGGLGVGDFGLLAGARQAERDGDWARAALLWQTLAADHRGEAGLPARAAAAWLALPPDPLRDVSAFVDLSVAVRLDPHDPIAARLFRRAAARTRLRPVHDVDDSAGIVSVEGVAGPDDSVEAALVPEELTGPGQLVTRDRQLSLSLNLAAPAALRLEGRPRELRPAGARAVASPAIALEWSQDGEPPRQVPCPPAAGLCRTEAIHLPAGAHTLLVRLQGGLRPAARVAVAQAACARRTCRRVAVGRGAEYLLARTQQPVVVTLYGPGAVEAELRSTSRRRVSLSVLRSDGGRTVQRVSLAGAAGPGAAAVETVVLERDQAYRLEVRPEHGEVLCRLLLRDGMGTGAAPPPAVPSTLVAVGPPPLLAAPDLEHALETRASDGDVAPGWDDLGTLALAAGWQTAGDLSETVELPANSAALVTVTYRRLVERLHLSVKLAGEARLWRRGLPSEAAWLHAYFMHPQARWARVFVAAGSATQRLGPDRLSSADGLVMLEPVARLRSGLHLVSKAGLHLRWQSTERMSRAALEELDPEVWSGYAARHRRALFWEEGLELTPLRDLLIYGGARVTSGEALSWRPDHLTGSAVVRTAFERLTVSAGFRWTWFLPGAARREALTSRAVALALSHTFWLGNRHALLIGVEGDHLIDLQVPQLVLRLGWEVSNGRRLRDHTAVEDENYFYGRRGPGREAGTVTVEGP